MIFEVSHLISNNSTAKRVVALEPWGMEYEIPPGDELVVTFISDREGFLETDESEQRTVLFAWPTCAARVHRRAELLGEHGRVPDVPQGMSVKDFIGMLYSGKS